VGRQEDLGRCQSSSGPTDGANNYMRRTGPAIIGTVILIGLIRLLATAFSGGDGLDVLGSILLSIGIALWIGFVLHRRQESKGDK
jgi:hypothetical protein